MRHVYSLYHLGRKFQSERNLISARSGWRSLRWLAVVAIAFAAVSAYAFQDSPALQAVTRSGPSHSAPAHKQQESTQKSQGGDTGFDAEQYKPLMEELGRLQEKLMQGVQFPAPRTQSHLLPLMPSGSSFFVGVPNYGDALHQSYQIFQQELQESQVLNDFWKNKVGMASLIVDEAVNKTTQLLQFFGDEIAVSGTLNSKSGSFLVVTEARKPGLKAFIQQIVGQYGSKTKPPVVVYTPQQLALAKPASHKPLVILVRPDFIVASPDLATLRSFNAQLNRKTNFSSTPFGEKIAQVYQGGASMVFAADLHQLLGLRPHGNPKDEAAFNESGFNDVKYLVGQGQFSGGVASSSMEISFAGPRHGIASWLAAPTALTGLEFISRDAGYVAAFNLKNFGQIFDDIKSLAATSNPMVDAGLAQMEDQLKIKFKDDLFSKFTGQLVISVDGPIMPTPAWKVVAQLVDADGVERTLKQLIAFARDKVPEGLNIGQETESGVNYYKFSIPNTPKPIDVECAFADGFLVVGGSRATVRQAIRIRRNGNSLAKASEFQDLLPHEQGNGASGILYQNLGRILGPMAEQMPPDQAQIFEMVSRYSKPSATTIYGLDDAIRIVGKSRGVDPSALVLAAAVIPNLTRSKNMANEAAAVSAVRTLTTAEVMYQTTYANRGFAPDLTTLGPDPGGKCDTPSEAHACNIDANLGCSSKWCFHNGFKFNITGTCDGLLCSDYVVVAAPVDPSTGLKSYCSTSDGVVRASKGSLKAPVSTAMCQTWAPI